MKTKGYGDGFMITAGYTLIIMGIFGGIAMLISGIVMVNFWRIFGGIGISLYGYVLGSAIIYSSDVPELKVITKYTSDKVTTNGKKIIVFSDEIELLKKQNIELQNRLNELKKNLNK